MKKIPLKQRKAVFLKALEFAVAIKDEDGIQAVTKTVLFRCVDRAAKFVGVTLSDAEELAQVAALIAS